jgi:methionyl aminopeptidase
LIKLKDPHELAIMGEAGRIVGDCHVALRHLVKPGVTTGELDRFIEEFIRSRGAEPSFLGYNGFPASSCTSINDVICHGIPGSERLQDGDLISIDLGAYYKGYHGDSAWTYAVGTIAPSAQRLMDITLEALQRGIAAARVGNRLSDISHAIQAYAEAEGTGVVREFTGHGIGRAMHEAPSLPHYGPPGTGPVLREGLVLAIEPMLTLGNWRARLEADGWTARTVDGSLCAQYEHTVAITANGPVILTAQDG